ncbi:MAG: hypothetical protein PHO67_07825 [Candidatus Omnitrophica bacterium]|nr:hypothetical protein [Candidatus Omnitrophota bacterium]
MKDYTGGGIYLVAAGIWTTAAILSWYVDYNAAMWFAWVFAALSILCCFGGE